MAKINDVQVIEKNTGKIVVAGTGDDFLKGDVLTSVYLGGKKE